MLDNPPWKIKAVTALALTLAAAHLACGAPTDQRASPVPPMPPPAAKPWLELQVSYTNHAWAVPLFVAEERRLFAHQGLQVKVKSLGYPIHIRIGGRLAPGESGLQIETLGGTLRHEDFEGIEVLESFGLELAKRPGAASRLMFVHPVGITPTGDMIMALLVRNGAGIKAWQDFKGKRIGIYEPGDISVLQRVFRDKGVSAFSGKSDDIPSARLWRGDHFDSGQIDALYTWGSIARRLLAERQGAYRVFAQNLDCEPGGLPWYEVCTYINRQALTRKPDVIRRYVAAIDEAIDFIRAFPEQTRTIVPKHCRLDPEVAKRMEIYHFLRSTERLDIDSLNRDRASLRIERSNVHRSTASAPVGPSGRTGDVPITSEIYYPLWLEKGRAGANR